MDSLIKIGEALLLVACIALIIFIGLRYFSGHKYAKSIFGGRKIVERSLDIPMEGNLLAASYILDNADFLDTPHLNANLSAAFLFRWYLEGKVKFDDGLLAFTEGPEPQDKFEKGIYRIFRKAAGDDLLIDELDEVKRVFYLEGDPKAD